MYESEEKEKLVVLGSGWAALSLINTINTYKYDVVVVSPHNYFLFTPLLTDVALGISSVERLVLDLFLPQKTYLIFIYSVVEPVRRYSRGNGLKFLEAKATDIDVDKKVVTCKGVYQRIQLIFPF